MNDIFPCKQMPTTQKYRDEHDRIFGGKKNTKDDVVKRKTKKNKLKKSD